MAHPTTSSTPLSGLRRAGALALALGLLAPAALAQGTDQISYRDSNGRERSWRGTVTENSLTRTSIDVDGRARNVDSANVLRVVFGDVPQSYAEASAYQDRGDFENAAAQYQVAAGDASARDVVQADARLRAAKAWMRNGGQDRSAFTEATAQLERFLSDFAEDRAVPEARFLLARCQWLAGDPTAATETYAALYGEVQADQASPGYDLLTCYGAGVGAGRSALAAGDTARAGELFTGVSTALTSVLAGQDEGAPGYYDLSNLLAEARLGEGFVLLENGSVSQARTFFQGQLTSAPATGAQRHGARLGLGLALLADGSAVEAQVELAQVSALDHTSRDRVARALVALAECALQISNPDGRDQAKTWLGTVRDEYGDTPSALRAQELLTTL